jgi:hypothetical protein
MDPLLFQALGFGVTALGIVMKDFHFIDSDQTMFGKDFLDQI